VRILAFSYLAFALVVTLAARDPTLSLGPDVVTRAFIPNRPGKPRAFSLAAFARYRLLFSAPRARQVGRFSIEAAAAHPEM